MTNDNFCIILTSIGTDDTHLSVLVAALSSVHQWFLLGIHLGLSHSTLKTIQQNERGQVEMCRIEMLDVWLKGPEEKRSKYYLQLALQQLSPEEHQVIIHAHTQLDNNYSTACGGIYYASL